MEFKRMLLELSRRIRDTDLDEMKHLCSEQVPVSRQEKIQTSLQLFQELEELGELDENKLELLKSILSSRKDLVRLVVAFQQGSWQGSESQGILSMQRELEKDFDVVSENLNSREWQRLARQVGVSDTDIDNLTTKYHGNVREQIRQALRRWSETNETASRRTLLDGLRACSMNNTAFILETSRKS